MQHDFTKLYTSSPILIKIEDGYLYSPYNKITPLYYIQHVDIPKHSLVLIEGANGTGKSTLFNYITGNADINQFKGKITLDHSVKQCSYLSSPTLLTKGTVVDNLFERDYKRELLSILNINFLNKKINDNPVNLSYGEQQKLSLLRVLSSDSDVILLDEPFTNLDAETRYNLTNYLIANKNNKSIIVIDHSGILKEKADIILAIKQHTMMQLNPKIRDCL